MQFFKWLSLFLLLGLFLGFFLLDLGIRASRRARTLLAESFRIKSLELSPTFRSAHILHRL